MWSMNVLLKSIFNVSHLKTLSAHSFINFLHAFRLHSCIIIPCKEKKEQLNQQKSKIQKHYFHAHCTIVFIIIGVIFECLKKV